MVKYQKYNKSQFMLWTDDPSTNKIIDETLRAKIEGIEHNPRFKMGAIDEYQRFYEVQKKDNGWLFLISNGFLDLLKSKIFFESPETQELVLNDEIMKYLKETIPTLPFKPRKYQLKAIVEGIKNPNSLLISCVGSGKSLMIYLMLRFYWERNEKSILVVPSISLVNQMFNDGLEYFRIDDRMKEFAEEKEKLLDEIEMMECSKEDKEHYISLLEEKECM